MIFGVIVYHLFLSSRLNGTSMTYLARSHSLAADQTNRYRASPALWTYNCHNRQDALSVRRIVEARKIQRSQRSPTQKRPLRPENREQPNS
jgi:hypothetical protein